MKYILNEQFILNEKFNLEERFILTEAELTQKDITELASNIINAKTKLNDFSKRNELAQINNYINELKKSNENRNAAFTELDNLVNTIEKEKNTITNYSNLENFIKKLQGKINDYINKYKTSPLFDNNVQNIQKAVLDAYKKLQDTLNTANSTAISQTNTSDLLSAVFTDFNTLVTSIKQAADPANWNNPNKTRTKINQDVTNLTGASTELDNILVKDTLLVNISNLEDIPDIKINGKIYIDAIVNFNKVYPSEIRLIQGKLDPKLYYKIDDTLLNRINTLIENLKKLSIDTIQKEKQNAEAEATAQNQNAKAEATAQNLEDKWAQKFKEAGTDPKARKAVWEEYYKEEWGDNAIKIKNLGPAFSEEVRELGTNPIRNPFIAYLKGNIDNLSALNYNIYGTIHNAFTEGIVTAKDLKRIGPFGENNAIFCNDFYKQTALDASEILTLQRGILQAADYKTIISNSDNFTDEAKVKYFTINGNDMVLNKDKLEDFIQAFLYQPGNIFNGKTGDIKNTIYPITTLKNTFESCFGKGTATNKLNLSNDNILNGIVGELKTAGIDTKETAGLVIKYLLVLAQNITKDDKQNISKRYGDITASKAFNIWDVPDRCIPIIRKIDLGSITKDTLQKLTDAIVKLVDKDFPLPDTK